MNLPRNYVFTFFTSNQDFASQGNRLIREIQEMYNLLSYKYFSLENAADWKPALVGGEDINYTKQEGKHLQTPHYHEFFFRMAGNTPKERSFILQLPKGGKYSLLPASGVVRGKIESYPFIGGLNVKNSDHGEIWVVSRIPQMLTTGREFVVEGAVKVMRDR